MLDWDIDKEIVNCVPNVGNFKVRDTKYEKTIELYWHIKMMVEESYRTKMKLGRWYYYN